MIPEYRTHRLAVALVLTVLAILALGCSTKDDPDEVLALCGNHSCGQLVMVTIDTSSSGYQYLEPALSPDGTRIAFTADWRVIPSLDEDEYQEPFESRQILIMPVPPDIWAESMIYRKPVEEVEQLGAQLVRLAEFSHIVGGSPIPVTTAHRIDKSGPLWLDNDHLLFVARFGRRDRILTADITNPAVATAQVVFYEPDDLAETGGWIYYHKDPALSPDGRWLAFTRFGCDAEPNAPDVYCAPTELWVLDMQTTSDPTQVTAFPLTSGAMILKDPTWSPDGSVICFAATSDLVGQYTNAITELFRIRFDAEEAELGAVTVDHQLRRLTTTTVADGDPIVGLANYAPTFDLTGGQIYFVSTRRTPASTLRVRNIWRIPSDGRLEPSILFYSRRDDIDPFVNRADGSLLLSSGMGFPTEMLDALEQATIDSLRAANEDPDIPIPLTEIEILRRAQTARDELEFFEGVMSHLYMFRRF